MHGISKYLLIGLFFVTFIQSTHAQNDTTWYWRRGDDPDSVKRTRAELDSLLELHKQWLFDSTSGEQLDLNGANLRDLSLFRANLSGAHLENVNLTYAFFMSTKFIGVHLEGAILAYAHLNNANLMGAQLKSANLNNAKLNGANLSGANLEDVKLFSADLSCADLNKTYLKGAYLIGASLKDASLWDAHLEGAYLNEATLRGSKLYRVRLENVRFEDIDSLPDIASIASASGLRTLMYDSSTTSLIELRNAFEKAGYKRQERDVICAFKRHNPHFLEYIFFDLTSEYGSNLTRPWWIVLGLWFFCGIIYYLFIMIKKNSGIKLTVYEAPNSEGIQSSMKNSVILDIPKKEFILHRTQGLLQRSTGINDWSKMPMWWRLIWWALYFSALSAFNIGFRDVKFGRLLLLLTRRKYDLTPFGWVRVISGFQALLSVYLIALWILSFIGTPFK